jgi:hypothetical protein
MALAAFALLLCLLFPGKALGKNNQTSDGLSLYVYHLRFMDLLPLQDSDWAQVFADLRQ